MSVLAKRQRRRKMLRARLLILIILVLAILAIIPFGRGFVSTYQLRHEIETLEKEIGAMRMRNDTLEQEIERMKSPEYVERVAREELGLVKPGETLYILSEPEDEK